jgi:hypothetical protein
MGKLTDLLENLHILSTKFGQEAPEGFATVGPKLNDVRPPPSLPPTPLLLFVDTSLLVPLPLWIPLI